MHKLLERNWSKQDSDVCLQGMGFSKTKAKEALEEGHYRLDMAVEWLMSHCV